MSFAIAIASSYLEICRAREHVPVQREWKGVGGTMEARAVAEGPKLVAGSDDAQWNMMLVLEIQRF